MEDLIPKSSEILQIGDTSDRISCRINRLLNNPVKHLVLDSDPLLDQAKKTHGAGFRICNRSLAKTTVKDLEEAYKLKFDFLVLTDGSCPYTSPSLGTSFKFVWAENLKWEGFYHIGHFIYVNTNLLPFKIRSHKLHHGVPGFFGMLGHTTVPVKSTIVPVKSTTVPVKSTTVPVKSTIVPVKSTIVPVKSTVEKINQIDVPQGVYPISAHGPSTLVIETDYEMDLQGFASATAQECPEMKFYCDEDLIGVITTKETRTPAYKMSTGLHLLTVESDNRWCHSLWFLSK